MSDVNSILESMLRHRAVLAEASQINKKTIFEAVAASGLTRIHVTFDGEGDSGQIEDVSAFAGDVATAIPDKRLSLRAISWGATQAVIEEQSLSNAIEQLCYDFLDQEYGGWENNDGAFGEFTLDVAGGTVELVFNGRYSDVNTTTHTF